MTINVEKFEEIFGAEQVDVVPNQDEISFLEQRSKIENEIANYISIEEYLYHYPTLINYGLEDLMLERVEHEIWYQCHYNPEEFRKSEFYDLFKDKRIVQKHFNRISEK